MGASKPRAERSVALGSWHAKKFVKHKKISKNLFFDKIVQKYQFNGFVTIHLFCSWTGL
jgi:hypothetical protein